MDVPTKGVPVTVEMLQRIERKVASYFGQEHPEVSPRKTERRKQRRLGFFLLLWAAAVQRMVDLCQANMSDPLFAEITGAPPGWLEAHRDQTNLLATGLEFDVRELDPEFVSLTLKAINETVIPQDVNGITNRAKWTRVQWRMINPRLAREIVQDDGDASQQIFEQVQSDIQGMFIGDEAQYVEMDPAAKAKLAYTQQVIAANPNYGRALQAGGRFAELLQKYVKNLQFSITQDQNKQVGRIGVQGGPANDVMPANLMGNLVGGA
jgi:hypothetical protein